MGRLGVTMAKNKKNFTNLGGSEDWRIARELLKLNVTAESALDSEGKERFHPLCLQDHFNGRFPEWLGEFSINLPQKVHPI